MSKKNRDAQEKTRPAGGGESSRWADYFWANVIFFAFLFILVFVVKSSCESPSDAQSPAIKIVLDQTFNFLVLLFGGGFLLVTLFDAAYEFFSGRAQEDVPAEGTPKA